MEDLHIDDTDNDDDDDDEELIDLCVCVRACMY